MASHEVCLKAEHCMYEKQHPLGLVYLLVKTWESDYLCKTLFSPFTTVKVL